MWEVGKEGLSTNFEGRIKNTKTSDKNILKMVVYSVSPWESIGVIILV